MIIAICQIVPFFGLDFMFLILKKPKPFNCNNVEKVLLFGTFMLYSQNKGNLLLNWSKCFVCLIFLIPMCYIKLQRIELECFIFKIDTWVICWGTIFNRLSLSPSPSLFGYLLKLLKMYNTKSKKEGKLHIWSFKNRERRTLNGIISLNEKLKWIYK